MARRSGSEKINYVIIPSIGAGSGLVEVVAATEGYIVAPKSVVISSHGSGNVEGELTTNGDVFLYAHIPSNDSHQYDFPDGLELPIGSGVEVEFTGSDGSVNFYYVLYDESARVTKAAARLATTVPSVTRTPTRFGTQTQS